MAEFQSQPPPPPAAAAQIQHWCYQCNKRVAVESNSDVPNDVVCVECKSGFVESIAAAEEDGDNGYDDNPSFGTEFLQVLRMIARAAREDDEEDAREDDEEDGGEDDAPPSVGEREVRRMIAQATREVDEDEAREYYAPPSAGGRETRYLFDRATRQLDDGDARDVIAPPSIGDREARYLFARARRQLDDEEAREEIAPPSPPPVVNRGGGGDYLRIEIGRLENEHEDEDGDENENEYEEELNDGIGNRSEEDEDEREEMERLRTRTEVLRERLREFASRATSRRDRILDWADILMGLEDHSVEFRLRFPGMEDEYIGNPGDYVDDAGYESLLQNLAETDGRRGAPPAAKSVVLGLKEVEINSEVDAELCAICKDMVNVGEMCKKLPCGHGYHGDCILPWLGSRNTCPVCRFELPTDDPEYEEDRKKRMVVTSDGGCPSSSG